MYKRENRWGNSPINFLSMLLFVIFITLIILVADGVISGDLSNGIIASLITGILEVIPFGGKIGEIVFKTVSSTFEFAATPSTGSSSTFSMLDFITEIMTLLVAAVAYQALFAFLKGITELNVREGLWNQLQKALLDFFSAFLAGFIAGKICLFFINQLKLFSVQLQYILPILIALVTAGGLFAVVFLITTITSLTTFVLGFFIKFILSNIVKLLATYVFMLLILVGAYDGNFTKVLAGCGGIIVIFIMLGAIDVMLKPVFGD